jgi:L-ascorbate metabolism protein UlaG (beta-lactamase superfamily)
MLQLAFSFSIAHSVDATDPNLDTASHEKSGVILKWLGTAGWEIQTKNSTILIDPFVTRKDPSLNAAWQTDEEAVLKVIARADYIFAGHSHHDHIGDVPFIAKRFKSKIIGSRTTTNMALTAGVDKSQTVTVNGGEKLDFKDFSVEVVESRHGWLNGKPVRKENEEVYKPWRGPIMGGDFVDGGSFLYYFTFGHKRLLHQSTGNFVMDKLKGLQPDIALMNVGRQGYDFASALRTLKPKVIIVHHFDDWAAPFSEGISEANLKRARGFARDVRAVDSEIKVIIPELLMTYHVRLDT